MQPASSAGVVAFGVYEVDLRSGELRKRGVRVPLQQQPFVLLARLIERRGELVTREELRQELWPEQTFVDFEHGLNAAVKRLREALGDSADTPSFIETLPKRGYRFIAPVTVVVPAGGRDRPVTSVAALRPGFRVGWLLAGVAIVAVGAPAAMLLIERREPALTDRDTILVADFVNRTGDGVYDGALREALTIDLEQSPFLAVVSRERVRDTLQEMRRLPDAPVIGAVARETCERAGARVSVNGGIAAIGHQLLVTLEAINCLTGTSVAEEQATAGDRDHVLAALHDAASALRRRVGESPSTIEHFDAPLRQATTGSLEALRTFSAAEDVRDQQGDSHAEPLYRTALEQDPDFAMAYARLSAVVRNTRGNADEIPHLIKEAVARRDRVGARERIYIDLHACGLSLDPDCTLHVTEVWRRTYPRDWEPYANLCAVYIARRGEFEEALPNCIESARINPRNSLAVGNLAGAYRALDRFLDARRVTDEAFARGVRSTTMRETRYSIAFALGDRAAMDGEARAMAGDIEEPRFLLMEGEAAAFEGRFAEAKARLAQAEARDAGRVPGLIARGRIQTAIFAAAAGFTSPDAYATAPSELDLMLALLQHDLHHAEELLADLPKRVAPGGIGIAAQVLLDLERGARDATGRLPPPNAAECGTNAGYRPIYLRGLAYLRAGDGPRAVAEFQRILAHRGVHPTSALYSISYVQQARAYALTGDAASARRDYEWFFELWKNADAGVPILKAARAEYARLPIR